LIFIDSPTLTYIYTDQGGHISQIWTFIAPISPPKKWASRQLLASPPLIFCPPPRRALDLAEVWKSRRECGQKKGIHKGDIIIQQLLVDVFQGISMYIVYIYVLVINYQTGVAIFVGAYDVLKAYVINYMAYVGVLLTKNGPQKRCQIGLHPP